MAKTDWEKRLKEEVVCSCGSKGHWSNCPSVRALALLREFAEEAAGRVICENDARVILSMLPKKED